MKNCRISLLFLAVALIVIFTAMSVNNAGAAFFSKSSSDYYKEGLNHFKKKNYFYSTQSLLKALQLKPDYPDASKLLGFNYIKTGRGADAERIFRDCFRRENTDVEAFQGMGWSNYLLGKQKDAADFFKKEIAWANEHMGKSDYSYYLPADREIIESFYSDGNYGLALLAGVQGDNALAAKHFEQALKYKSIFTPANEILTAWGDMYYYKAKYKEAIPLYEKAVEENKENPAACLKKAWAHYFDKNYSAALKSFEQALPVSQKHESVESLYGIALCNYHLNNLDQAYGNFAKAIAINPYYMDNEIVHGIIEKKPEWKTLWKNFGLAYKNIYPYNYAGSYAAALYKLDGYLSKINSKDVEAILASGWCSHGLGYGNAARDSFRTALNLDPKNEEAYVGTGFTYLAENKPADAFSAFQQALQINPQSPAAYNGLAYYYYAQKDEGKSLDALRKSVSLKKDYFDSQAFIANVLFQQKKFGEAVKEYEKLINIDKSVVYSWNMSGWSYYNAGIYDKALQAFSESKKITPFLAESHYGAGLCLAKDDEMDDARDELETAINLYPSYAHSAELIGLIKANAKWRDMYKTLGWSYYYYQQYQPAAAAFQEYLAVKSGDSEALRGLAWSEYWLGKLDSAYAGFKAIVDKNQQDGDALTGMGWVLYLRNQHAESLSCLEKAVQIDDKNVNAWRTIAAINFLAKKYAAAENIYKKIGELQPYAVDAYNNQGWSLYRENKYNEALAKFNESLRVNKKMGEPYYGLALSYLRLGNNGKAKENFSTAMYLYPAYMDNKELYAILDGEPTLKELYNTLGWGYYYQYSYDKAKFHFENMLKADAKNHDAILGIGTIAYVTGNYKQAADEYGKLLPDVPATAAAWDKHSYMLDNLAWSHYYRKDYDKALEIFKRLKNYHPAVGYVAPINGEAWCELMKGNKTRAQALFQESLKILPYNYAAETGLKAINK